MTLADILVVMNGGQVEQIGKPLDIYQKPATTFVASFIGAPPMNLLPMRVGRHSSRNSATRAEAGILGIRPEDFVVTNDAAGGIALRSHRGGDRAGRCRNLHLRHPAARRAGGCRQPRRAAAGRGASCGSPARWRPRIGERIRAVAPREKLHLFSADGRKRIELVSLRRQRRACPERLPRRFAGSRGA